MDNEPTKEAKNLHFIKACNKFKDAVFKSDGETLACLRNPNESITPTKDALRNIALNNICNEFKDATFVETPDYSICYRNNGNKEKDNIAKLSR